MAHTLVPAVEMRAISKRFGSVVANDGVTFTAMPGEVHAIVGENGAGKSTLMSILVGMYRADEGELLINGQPVRFSSPRDATELGIGMVYQHFMLVDTFTVVENVMLGQPDAGWQLQPGETENHLRDLAAKFQLHINPRAYIWQLSVGEQQRVEILRLLHRGARILVFDEPTAVLTPQESKSLLEHMKLLASQGFAIIFISHKLDEVLDVADRITVLRRGQVVGSSNRGELTRIELARMMVGRELAGALLRDTSGDQHQSGAAVLQLDRVRAKSDVGTDALHDLSLEVRSGEVLGIAGVAGNGQRELAEVITGLRSVTSGSIRLQGKSIENASARAIARSGVAHIPEDRLGTGLAGSLDLSDNAIVRSYQKAPIARGPFQVRGAITDFARGLIQRFDVKAPGLRTKLRDLSGGNQQKLLIGRELVGEPKLIVAVHPTRGVDVGAAEAIHAELWRQRDRGAAILLISEDLEELLNLSDRIAVIYEGQIAGEMPVTDADPAHIGLLMSGSRDAA